MAIKFPDSDGFGNPGTPELSFETHIALEFTTDSASYSEYGDDAHRTFTQSKRPHKLSRYYRNGPEVPDAQVNSKIGESGEIKFSDFYGAVNEITIEFIANQYIINGTSYTANKSTALNMYNIASLAITPNAGTITVPFVFKFDSDTVFNNSVRMGGNFSQLTIENDGIIAGRGGDGAGYGKSTPDTGNSAIILDGNATLVEIENTTNGIIAGGGNGGASSTFGSQTNHFSQSTNSEGHVQRVFRWGTYGGGGGWNGGIGGAARADGYAEVRSGPNSGDGHETNSPDQNFGTSSASSTRTVVLNRTGGAGAAHQNATTGVIFAGTWQVADDTPTVYIPFASVTNESQTAWRGTPGDFASAHRFSVSSNIVGGAKLNVKASTGSNGGAALPPDTGGGSQATGPGGGNSVEKTGSISTLTYVGSTAQYYGTRDT